MDTTDRRGGRLRLDVIAVGLRQDCLAAARAALEQAGFDVDCQAVSGERGLKSALARQAWDAALIASSGRGTQAASAARVIHAHHPELPFYVVATPAPAGRAGPRAGGDPGEPAGPPDLSWLALAIGRERRLRDAAPAGAAAAAVALDAGVLALLDDSIVGALVVREGQPVFANRALARLLGCETPERLIASGALAPLIGQSAAPDRAASDTAAGWCEAELRGEDGSPVWLQGRCSRIAWQGGPAQLFVAVDVSESRRALKALEHQQALLRAVIDTMPHRLFVKDGAGRYVLVNKAFADVAKKSAEEIVGLHTSELQPGDLVDRERKLSSDRAVLEDGQERVDGTDPFTRPDGSTGYLRTIKTRFQPPDGGAPGLVGISEDVSAVREAALTAEASQARLLDAIESSPAGIYYLDPEGRLELWNSRVAELFPALAGKLRAGAAFEDLVRAAAASIRVPDGDVQRWEAWRRERVAHPPDEPFELELVNGRTILVQDRRARSGGNFVVIVDITEHKRATQRLQESERLLQAVFNTIPHAVYVKDAGGRYVMANDRYLQGLGLSRDEVLGRTVQEQTRRPEKERGAAWALDQSILAGAVELSDQVWELTMGDGQVHAARIVKAPLKGVDGSIVGLVGISEDVTDVQRMQSELESGRRLLQAVFDTIPHLLFVKDTERRYLMVNAAFERTFGRESAEIVGQRLDDLPQRPELDLLLLAEHDRQVLTGGVPRLQSVHESGIVDGGRRLIRTIRTPLRDSEGRVFGLVGVAEDITEYERAQRVLREHEALLQAMFDTLPQMVFVEDRERRYLMVNRNFADAMGMSPAMMVGKHADEIAAAPEHEAIRAADADRAILSGAEAATTLVQELVFADGVPRVVRSMRRPLRDGSGQVTGLVGIIEDITALQAAEQQANLAHARLADAIQHLWGGIYLFDREERLVMWNEKVHDLFPSLRGRLRPGMTFEEILRIAGPDVELPDLAPEAQLQARLEEFRNPPEHLIEHRLQDGRWVLVRDRHTSEGGTVCLRLDVTEQKQAQEALRESEQRFRMLTENAPDMLFRYRIWPERGFEYVSPISTAIIGYSPQEHYADPDLWVRIADPDSRAQQERMFDPESDIVGALVSVRWKYKGAGWIWIEVRATPVLDEQGRQVALEGIVRDISARKELEGQLLQSQRMEAVGRLAGGIAHDFNNMLTIMSNYATFALEAQPEGSPASDDIRVILKTIERSTALTRQLLAFSRKQILQMKLVQLNDLIRETGSILERVIGEDIELALNLAEDLWLVNADASQVEQIVMNLAVNARDAMPKGGALILETSNVEFAAGAALGAAAELAGPYVMLAVTDTGTGMPPAVRERIFEPFYTTKPTGQGTGLGLSTVHGIVKQMHGEIWVYSEEGIGTTFKIYLPRAEAAGPPRPAPDVLRAPKRGTETILLVEDEELVRLAVQRVLQGAGYRVIAAANPLAAESIVTQAAEPIHLLLTDVVMPETSGPELVQRLLKRQPSLRVLYMTGYTETALASHFPTRGAQASVVQKPFSRSSLLQAVRGVLDAAAG